MTVQFRLPPIMRGMPARAGTVLLIAAVFGAWGVWPGSPTSEATPASLALDGKHADRLAFGADETHIPVREARIYDTIAMFAQHAAEPRAWSEIPIRATVQEAGIKPTMPRNGASGALRRTPDPSTMVAKPVRTASADAGRAKVSPKDETGPTSFLSWNVPGSDYLPNRRDAARAFDKVGNGAASVGSGTVRVISRAASTLGDGVMSAGGAIAGTFGLD